MIFVLRELMVEDGLAVFDIFLKSKDICAG